MEIRFWSKVSVTADVSDCWIWTASLDTSGYGSFRINGTLRGAHRVAYELARGPIPHGLQVDHLCRRRACCNAAHMEAVTQAVNMDRGGIGAHRRAQRAKTECIHGHSLSDDNVYVCKRGKRSCKTCMRASELRQREAKRVA